MSDADEALMLRAVALGRRGRLSAPPNPWVGALVVTGGEVVGEGFHSGPGSPHAEIEALREAADRALGATVYVSLEPCDHVGLTPRCTEALVAAGVSRVAAAIEDPDARVSGRGARRLREAGITVDVGVGREAAERSLRPYLHHRTTGRPFCLLKAAVSLDGRTAAADGSARWITGPEARADAHRLRAESQAVLVGAGTAMTDRPALTVRDHEPPPRPPLRVVVDAAGRVPAEGPLFDQDLAPTLVVTTGAAPPDAVAAWKSAGAEIAEVTADPDGGVDLEATLALLGRRGVVQVLVEGGAGVHGRLVRRGLADGLVLYVGGTVLGDSGRPLLAGLPVPTIGAAPRWRIVEVEALGDGARLDCEPVRGA